MDQQGLPAKQNVVDVDQKLCGSSRQIICMAEKPPVRHCPVCRLAMVGSKSRDDLERPDIFHCLNCGTEIIETPRPKPRQDQGDDKGDDR